MYKKYVFMNEKGNIHYLFAKNGREAMKLISSWVRCYGDIYWLKEVSGKFIIENREQ